VDFNRASLESIESEVQIEIGRRVPVEYAEPDALAVRGDHGDSVDVCRLQASVLDPNRVGRTGAASISLDPKT
jgi:hypothetical protein